MPGPFEKLSSLDRLIHEPARLAILTALNACRSADFLFLLSITGLTKGNLTTHLAKLERAGLVTIQKVLRGKVPRTQLALTEHGRQMIKEHWRRLEALRKAAQKWRAPSMVHS